ncbi:c-type cytochrome [Aquimarina longa]|uniref:c-type cytochrome n=1 Tax=Aquimarina longa TaxID=1080221 RepID=UPI000780BA68|nr:c-type cytochrome [Aquimarina longa]
MKKIRLLIIVIPLLIISCQSDKKGKKEEIKIGTNKQQMNPYNLGESVFNGKGKCYTCHKVNKKTIGPSILEIMKVYREKNGDLLAFLKEKSEPIVDPNTYSVMKTNFAIIKTFSSEELKALETYMTDVSQGKIK